MDQLIICIPGKWENESEIPNSVKDQFSFELYEYDESLANAFNIGSGNTLSDEEIEAIESHKTTLYLKFDGYSLENVKKAIKATKSILKEASGLGVKIENSGKASSPEKWLSLDENNPSDLYEAFIMIAGIDNYYYSCGMHCFGMKDSICFPEETDPGYAGNLLRMFCIYLLMENPDLKDNETFSVADEDPPFVMNHSKCDHFPEDDLFFNPFGVWVLNKLVTHK